jgi:hypothetical protein
MSSAWWIRFRPSYWSAREKVSNFVRCRGAAFGRVEQWRNVGGGTEAHTISPSAPAGLRGPNDTWGRIVPVEVLAAEVGMKREALRQGTLL